MIKMKGRGSMKKRDGMAYVIASAVLAVAAFANWVWTMKTYDATSIELFNPMSIPNEAMFGAIFAFIVFVVITVSVFDTKDDQKTEVQENAESVSRETVLTAADSTEGE